MTLNYYNNIIFIIKLLLIDHIYIFIYIFENEKMTRPKKGRYRIAWKKSNDMLLPRWVWSKSKLWLEMEFYFLFLGFWVIVEFYALPKGGMEENDSGNPTVVVVLFILLKKHGDDDRRCLFVLGFFFFFFKVWGILMIDELGYVDCGL